MGSGSKRVPLKYEKFKQEFLYLFESTNSFFINKYINWKSFVSHTLKMSNKHILNRFIHINIQSITGACMFIT